RPLWGRRPPTDNMMPPFSAPFPPDGRPGAATRPRPLKPPTGQRALRVLVVEDNPDGRGSTRLLLEMAGHQVEVAGDGARGLELGLEHRPDAAVLDIGLPLLDGYELARRLRAALGGGVFLIALTSYGGAEDRQRALAAGFDVHLVKPTEPAAL